MKFDGERYEVPLLWKGAAPPVRSNYFQAVNRLESVERQLKENPEKANAYKNMGYAVEVKDGDKKVRYLPHHADSREDKKTTKCVLSFVRWLMMTMRYRSILYSFRARLQPNLVSVLLRFRTRGVALMADVEKMFLQIKVDERDDDALRYHGGI